MNIMENKRMIPFSPPDISEFEINETDVFAVGNEGKGLSTEVIDACSMTSIIPMSGKTESLNAAIASAILLWEAKRGRM